MTNNPTTFLDQGIEGISFIEKDEHSIHDLEESINQCVVMFNNNYIDANQQEHKLLPRKQHLHVQSDRNSKPVRSILKTSKEKINEMKAKISQIFEDNTQLMQNIADINLKNLKEVNETFSQAQKIFDENMNNLYQEKLNALNVICGRYDNEIFKIRKYIEEEDEISRNSVSNCNSNNNNSEKSINKLILESIMKDKQKEIEKCEEGFKNKKRDVIMYYKQMTECGNDFSLNDRSVIYRNELFENIKEKVNEVVCPEKKNIGIKFEDGGFECFKKDNSCEEYNEEM